MNPAQTTNDFRPLALTIKAAALALGLDRKAVAGLCRRGELGFYPCISPDGKPSRIHRRIPLSEIQKYIAAHTIHSPEQFKRALDGRRTR